MELFENNPNGDYIIFNSKGGKTSVSLAVTREVKTAPKLVINEECSSNCAEIMLPFASKVEFVNNPIIAFHGNTFSYRYFVEAYAEKNTEYCNWLYADEMSHLYEQKGLNKHFWKTQMSILKPKVSFIYKAGKCPLRVYNFENSFWLPTSEQLKKGLGLEFTGSVCADDFYSCTLKINTRWRIGTRVVVGDKIYISKGQ